MAAPVVSDEEILALHSQGHNNAQIARALKLHGDTVRNRLKRLGLTNNYDVKAPRPHLHKSGRPKGVEIQVSGKKGKSQDENERARRLRLLQQINERVIARITEGEEINSEEHTRF